ncbi:ribonuclease H-like domain-containing protein [Bacillus sp. DJP31]|uniref:ribonuclease H-like domain-containing protein n=1 Tax=Bacillus sp. DJP31 TaxID=3409789 RepID=UPI003BB581E0
MSLKSKLNRMKKHLVTEVVETEVKVEQKQNTEEIPYLLDWEKFDAKPYYFEGEYIFIREKEYPLTAKHGLYEFGELHDVVQDWNSSPFSHPLSVSGFQAQDLFFFDTETTGLNGGTGTTIFLLGYARVFEKKVIVKQFFLPSPASEVALYHYFLQDVDYTTLVTYNGKAFDWPQVKTRHTLVRDHVPKLPKFGHFDLLHGSRRLWKKEYASLKLSIVEKEILHIVRESDTPGFMAPMIYFHYLEDPNPEGIFGMMSHNETDILTLISLYIHVSNKLLHTEQGSQAEKFEVARWLDSVGERQSAMEHFYELSQVAGNQTVEAKSALAALCKKEQNLSEATRLWVEVVADEQAPFPNNLIASIELAKYYEHKTKEVEKALQYAKMAIEFCRDGRENPMGKGKGYLQLEKRIHRLENKRRNSLNIS